MRDRFGKKVNNVIELTSLLDVIFIVLMVVVCNQQINMTAKTQEAQAVMAEADARTAEAEDAIAEAQAEKILYEEHRDTFKAISEQADIMTIYVTYTPSNPEDRMILIMKNGEELPRIQISPSNSGEALDDFSQLLETHVSKVEKADKPVIVSINTDRILYRDERSVRQILDGLSEKHDNIFYKQSGKQ